MNLISCITPTFNRASMLQKAIESNLAQNYKEWEHIVVDDQSTDNTEEVVYAYQKIDSRIKYFKNPLKGANNARNYGFENCEGDYINFLDDDNINLPHKFENQIKTAKKSGAHFLVSGVESREIETNKLLASYNCELKGKGAGFPQRWFLSREILVASKGWDPEMPSMQDVELSYRLAEIETFSFHNSIVSVMYDSKNSVSQNTANSVKGKIKLMEKQAHNMHPIEASWWYLNIFWSLLYLNNKQEALKFLNLAKTYESRLTEKVWIQLMQFLAYAPGLPAIKGTRVLFQIYSKHFPKLVFHPIV